MSALRLFREIPATIREWSRFLEGTALPLIYKGNGSPEGVVTADEGSLYFNKQGGAGATLYVKESGAGDTGWVAK